LWYWSLPSNCTLEELQSSSKATRGGSNPSHLPTVLAPEKSASGCRCVRMGITPFGALEEVHPEYSRSGSLMSPPDLKCCENLLNCNLGKKNCQVLLSQTSRTGRNNIQNSASESREPNKDMKRCAGAHGALTRHQTAE
jgi:hypothetical protein